MVHIKDFAGADEEGVLMGRDELQLGEAQSEFYVELVHDVLSCRECWFDGPFVVFCPCSMYHVDHPAHQCPLHQECRH